MSLDLPDLSPLFMDAIHVLRPASSYETSLAAHRSRAASRILGHWHALTLPFLICG